MITFHSIPVVFSVYKMIIDTKSLSGERASEGERERGGIQYISLALSIHVVDGFGVLGLPCMYIMCSPSSI